MAGGRGIKFGLFFSVVIFIVLYFLVYTKVSGGGNISLMLGKLDISFLGKFLSSMKNLIITSLVVGFILGLLTSGGRQRRQ
jgi:hypothetical protein